MIDRRVKPVRALERGLEVLAEVRRGPVALHDLHRRTGLPKATLLRMLVTLGQARLVWQRLADGAYLPSGGGGGEGGDALWRLAEVASPHLAALSREVAWPSALAVPRGDHMEVIETTSPLLKLDAAVLGPVGVGVSLVHTSVGRAWLAAASGPVRAQAIAAVRPPGSSGEGLQMLEAVLAQTATRGWASRDPAHPWPGRSAREVRQDGRRSIAVAVRVGGEAVGAVNITWPMRRMSEAEVVERHLAKLQRTAEAIGAGMGS